MYDLSKLAAYGDDVYIADNVVIKRPKLVVVGSHIAIDDYFYCTTQLEIGSYTHISPACIIIGGAEGLLVMEDFSDMSAGCRIVCASDEWLGEGLISPMIPKKYRDKVIIKPIIMKKFSGLCANVTLLPGVTLGEGAVVGANSFVNKDVPDWEIWGGNPARFLRKRPSEKMIQYGKELLG